MIFIFLRIHNFFNAFLFQIGHTEQRWDKKKKGILPVQPTNIDEEDSYAVKLYCTFLSFLLMASAKLSLPKFKTRNAFKSVERKKPCKTAKLILNRGTIILGLWVYFNRLSP